jgi:hypothetical protein
MSSSCEGVRAGVPAVADLAMLLSSYGPRAAPTSAPRRLDAGLDRQCHSAAIRELQITQMDLQTSFASAAALDNVARADRKVVGKTICERTHEHPPREFRTGRAMPPPRNSSITAGENWGLLWITVDRLTGAGHRGHRAWRPSELAGVRARAAVATGPGMACRPQRATTLCYLDDAGD